MSPTGSSSLGLCQIPHSGGTSKPADLATRGSSLEKLKDCIWLSVPELLKEHNLFQPTCTETFQIDTVDPEVRVTTYHTGVPNYWIGIKTICLSP